MIRSYLYPVAGWRMVATMLACAALVFASSVDAQDKPATEGDPEALLTAVVRIKAKALPNARSNATLGDSREGSGIVIDDRGHVLTIGYIVMEAASIEITTVANKTFPATLKGFDHATGFGLLTVSGLDAKPIGFGDSGKLAESEPVMVLPFGGRDAAVLARVVSTRRFAGSWEYMLDSAIFTSPPTMSWAGAALLNREAKLVGVGSLFVRDSSGRGQPGNMFVPTDLLKPILSDLIGAGKRAGPQRPWLGLATDEMLGRLFVSRVSPDSPADRAGMKQGDIVLGIGGEPVTSHVDLYNKLWKLGAAGVEVPLKVLQGVDVRDLKVQSIDRFDYFRQKPTL